MFSSGIFRIPSRKPVHAYIHFFRESFRVLSLVWSSNRRQLLAQSLFVLSNDRINLWLVEMTKLCFSDPHPWMCGALLLAVEPTVILIPRHIFFQAIIREPNTIMGHTHPASINLPWMLSQGEATTLASLDCTTGKFIEDKKQTILMVKQRHNFSDVFLFYLFYMSV